MRGVEPSIEIYMDTTKNRRYRLSRGHGNMKGWSIDGDVGISVRGVVTCAVVRRMGTMRFTVLEHAILTFLLDLQLPSRYFNPPPRLCTRSRVYIV